MEEYSIFFAPNDSIMEEEEFERLYAAPVEVIVLLSIFYGSISIVTIIGNTLVIWVVATTRQMRTVTNMYIANLAFADVIIGLFCIPFQFQAALLQRWNLPWFMCGFCPFVQALSVNVSVFTLTAIAIDRHRAIINPLRARPTTFASKFIIASIWFVSFVFAIPCAIAFRVELVEERFKENEIISNVTRPFCTNVNLSESQLLSYRYSLVFVQYLVPFCVISFVYIQMAIKLWGTHAPGNAQDSRDLTLLKNKKKVIKMLIIVVIVFGLCWLPLQLYNILYVTIPEINEYHFINIVWFCCDWLAMSNSCYNPFIYGIYNEKFKREFNKRFAVCFCRFRTSLDAHERTMSMPTRGSSMRTSYITTSLALPNSKGANHSPAILYSKRDLKRIPSLKTNDDYNKNHNLHNYSATVRRSCAALGVAATVNGEGTTTFLSTINPPASTLIESNATLNNNHHYCTVNGGSVSLDDSHRNDALQWQRNNFKPLHLELIECDGDENDEDATTTIVEDFLVMHKSKKNTASNVFKSSQNNQNPQNIDSLEEQPLKLNKSLQNINEPNKITSSINSKTHRNCDYVSNHKQRIGNVNYDNDADVENDDDDDADIHNIENCIYTVAPQKDCTGTTANANVNDVSAVDVAYPSNSLQPSEYTSLLSRSKNQTKSIT